MDIFSNLQVIGECLLDEDRTLAYLRAIRLSVSDGSVVLDAGTGSGIFALAAAQAGAKRVYAVEIAPDLLPIACTNFAANDVLNILLTHQDMRNIQVHEPLDVVIAEMFDTGMIAEHQCQAMNQLHTIGAIKESTIFIPSSITSLVALVEYDFNFYGFNMPFVIQARNDGASKRILTCLSDYMPYESVSFSHPIPEYVNNRVNVPIERSGTANAVILCSELSLPGESALRHTTDMNMPVVIPIEPTAVESGAVWGVRISYSRGHGFTNVAIELGHSE
ncbi:MAG: 50S ribosomal protein L11 methyltransferase [Armatimonadota bacterium]|nr:50S ribosomal protein L11 methyltransferase [Armatimonadota bacterium]